MRRLRARPADRLFEATGREAPKPAAFKRPDAIPTCSSRKRTTLVARAVESSQLVG